MFIFNMKKGEWGELFVPNPPPPRCSHQVGFFMSLHFAKKKFLSVAIFYVIKVKNHREQSKLCSIGTGIK